jgi:hypothetical protein
MTFFDWKWTIVATVMITYVHIFNHLTERYFEGDVVSWIDLVRVTTSTMEREQWLYALREKS